MNWHDYEAIWKRPAPPVGAAADLASLHQSFPGQSRKMDRLLFVRDVTEAGAGVLGSIGLAFAWWQEGPRAWPLAISLVILLGITFGFIGERRRARRVRLGAQASLLARVEADIAELKHQHQRFSAIGTWYYLPAITAIGIAAWTIVQRRDTSQPPGLIWDLLQDPFAATLIVATLLTFITATVMAWRTTRTSLKKHVEPRIAELEKLRTNLLP